MNNAEPSAGGPEDWIVGRVSGRGSDGSRGRPQVVSMEINHPDGRSLEVEHPEGGPAHLRHLHTARYTDFGLCPICGLAGQGTAEHVPQRDLGGTVMTRTCDRCNNQFGGLVEPHLLDWFDGAIRNVRFTADGVQQGYRVDRMLVRQTHLGEPVLMVDEDEHRLALTAMLQSGSLQMSGTEPDPRRIRAAAAKHAYLGACICLGQVPDTQGAEQLRAYLQVVRDLPRHAPLPTSSPIDGLLIGRMNRVADSGTVSVAELTTGKERIPGLSLAGTLFVSWPLEPEVLQRWTG